MSGSSGAPVILCVLFVAGCLIIYYIIVSFDVDTKKTFRKQEFNVDKHCAASNMEKKMRKVQTLVVLEYSEANGKRYIRITFSVRCYLVLISRL